MKGYCHCSSEKRSNCVCVREKNINKKTREIGKKSLPRNCKRIKDNTHQIDGNPCYLLNTKLITNDILQLQWSGLKTYKMSDMTRMEKNTCFNVETLIAGIVVVVVAVFFFNFILHGRQPLAWASMSGLFSVILAISINLHAIQLNPLMAKIMYWSTFQCLRTKKNFDLKWYLYHFYWNIGQLFVSFSHLKKKTIWFLTVISWHCVHSIQRDEALAKKAETQFDIPAVQMQLFSFLLLLKRHTIDWRQFAINSWICPYHNDIFILCSAQLQDFQ